MVLTLFSGLARTMQDPRFARLCHVLVDHSTKVTPGDKVLIEAFDTPVEFTVELIRTVACAGGHPLVSTYHQAVLRGLYQCATEEQMRCIGQVERMRMESVQCYIGVRGNHNITEMADVPPDRMQLYEKHWWEHVHTEVRVPHTRWVVLRWPHPSMAQAAGMSTEGFEDFYFRVCTQVDYARMAHAMAPLKDLMDRTDRVRITGPGTDLTFSKKGIPAVPCAGEANVPDGEVFTAPVRESVNGTLTYNTECLRRGTLFSGVRFEFRHGKIVDAQAGAGTPALNDMLDADEGARCVGEWSLGVNPHIHTPMKDTLFDEKIAGSFHLTPGQAYDEADNGNRSQLHWDMVVMQTPAYGGGEIYFDDILVRKDGLFVPEQLQPLNPDRLAEP
jgi:aminopeptidase